MRLAAGLVVALAVIGVSASFWMSGPREELRIKTGTLPEGTTTTKLELGEAPTYRANYHWPLKIQSTVKRSVHLKVRLDDPAPKGARALLKGETSILPEGYAEATLFFVPPSDPGPFECTVTLFSEDLPGWTHVYSFSARMQKRF